MATSLKFFTDAAAGSQCETITNTDAKTVYTANATKDRMIRQMIISSDDSSDQTATIRISDGSSTVTLGKVTIPDGAGTNGTDAAVDVVASLATVFTEVDNAGNKQLVVPAGWSVIVTMGAVTSGKSFMVAILGAAE
jgi:hypothetical protein